MSERDSSPDTRITLVAVKPGRFYDFFHTGGDRSGQITPGEDELAGISLVELG